MLYVFFFFALFLIINCTSDIFIFWGYPTDGTDGCVNTTAASWDSCVAACVNSTTYMLAYGNDDSCMLCNMFLVTTVAQSTKANGIKTAIKVDEPTDGCPGEMQSDEYTRTDTNDAYNVTYSDGVWTITYENKSCVDDTWTKFYRPLGQWCIKVVGGSAIVTRDDNECTSLGAAMSGIQSAAEVDLIIAESKNLSGSLSAYTYTGAWMAGVRTGSCNFLGAEDNAACAGLLAFNLNTDPYLSSYEMYTFVPNQPDSVEDRGTRHNCLALLVSQTSSSYQGDTYNAACPYQCNAASTVCMTSFVCGMPATL